MADSKARTSVWQGLNRMPFIADGEMRDIKNLCSDAYPYLTTRKGRKPYSFNIFIPSPEGEAYEANVVRLPEPGESEMGNIYKIVKSASASQYISGEFYYYSEGEWVQGIKDAAFLGIYSDVITYNSSPTLISTKYRTDEYFEYNSYPYGNSDYTYLYVGDKVKYMGTDTDEFKYGKTYEYKMYVGYSWVEVTSGSYTETVSVMPPASSYKGKCVRYNGETTETFTNGSLYKSYIRCYGYWVEVAACYEIVSAIPESADEGDQIRYTPSPSGAPVTKKYYRCEDEVLPDGTVIYFYATDNEATEYMEISFLPEASADNLGTTYFYTGITKSGQFAECVYEGGAYIWKEVSHPQVMRTVELAEYLKEHKGITLGRIIEIAAFLGKMAVLFETDTGVTKLYYDEKVWNVNNVTREAGKKLSVAGNKLIVGESGSYLHINNKGVTTFHTSASSFSVTIEASYATYGNGGEKAKWSSVSGDAESGEATFVILAPGGSGSGFETVYNGLNVEGTDFSVEFDGKTYYLTSESVTYEKNVEIYAWKVNDWYYDYADRLTIKATGVTEDFEWNNTGTGHPLYLTFASTDPHYYDVVTWKKRLWGYKDNVLYGTAADIFDSYGTVDWNRGDNTYLEAISQPIWQGGSITGLAALSNALILFKEDSLTVFTGNYPAIMSGSTIPCRGLSEENRESVAVGNESVFYLSQDGVYRFTGGIPQCISRNAKISGTNAVGVSDGNKYWLSLKEENGHALYVYDVSLGIWHKEDDFQATSFTMLDGDMYAADEKQIYNISTEQEDVEWEMVLWFDEGTHKLKKYKELSFRGYTGDCELQIKGDDGEWQAIRWTEDKLHVRFEPFTCEEFMIKLKGRGICQIKSLDRTFEVIE